MKNLYNNYILGNIMKHYKYEPFNVVEQLEEYIRDYPKDSAGYIYYAKMLIDIGNFDIAEQVLDFIDKTFPQARYEETKYYRVRLLMLTNRYEEAKEVFDKYKNEIMHRDPQNEIFEIVYDAITNKSLKRNYENRYLVNQMIEYRYEDFLKHIKKHMADSNKDSDNPNAVIFASDFPIDLILEEVKKYVPSDKRIFFSYNNDFYVFKYDNNGRINNKVVDYFRIVALHDTDNFITMYPLDSGAYLPYIDLNYLKDEKEKSSVKKLSRVDKFNQKYSNFIK